MTNCIIREATVDDLESIYQLEEQYGIDIYSKDSIISTFNYDYYYTYLMLIDNKVIGYISASIIFDECNLIKIIIDKNCRKKRVW